MADRLAAVGAAGGDFAAQPGHALDSAHGTAVRPRWLALDAFRGLSVAGMILVNNPGSWSHVYPPLAHAAWHGWTPTDLIFPFFLFAVGVSMTVSFRRRLAEGTGRRALLRRVGWRAAVIIALGLLLGGFPYYDLTTMRWPGVLQRIGLVYGLAGATYVLLPARSQRLLAAGLLLGYWAAMMLVPVPGVGAGSLAMEANLAQYVDSLLLSGHMWRPTWDPEGLLSTLPAVVTCLLGAFVGDWLASDRSGLEKATGLFVAGSAAMLAGSVWSIWFPVNKNLWTSSYVLLTGGIAAHVLALLYVVIDLRGWRTWGWPFYVYGSNALLVFLLTGLMARLLVMIEVPGGAGPDLSLKTWLYDHWFASWAGPLNGSLAFAVAFVLLWLFLMAVPYRLKLFFKV